MRSRRLALLGALLAMPAAGLAGKVRVSGSGSVTGGADDNLNAAVEPADRVGSTFGQIQTGLTLSSGPLESIGFASLRYRGRAFLDVPSLNSHSARLAAGIYLTPERWFSLSVSPDVGARWVADPDRQSLDVGVGTSVRLRPAHELSVLLGYDLAHRASVEPVFGGTTHAGRGGLEVHPADKTWIGSEYAIAAGPMVRYETVVEPAETAKRDDPTKDQDRRKDQTESDTFVEGQIAVRTPSVSHTVVLDVEQGLSDRVYLRGIAGLTLLVADQETSTAHFAQLSLGLRLP